MCVFVYVSLHNFFYFLNDRLTHGGVCVNGGNESLKLSSHFFLNQNPFNKQFDKDLSKDHPP